MGTKFLILFLNFALKQISLLCLILFTSPAFSQEAVPPRLSPLGMVTAHYKDTYLKITYGQPHKRGRVVFGNLVPFGQVWRTGANEATEITMTRDIIISGLDLKAGTYSLFTIPVADHWTILINSDVGLWGAYNYNPKMDVLKFDVAVESLADVVYEPFTLWIDQKNEKADLLMAWDKTRVKIPIQFLEPKP